MKKVLFLSGLTVISVCSASSMQSSVNNGSRSRTSLSRNENSRGFSQNPRLNRLHPYMNR